MQPQDSVHGHGNGLLPLKFTGLEEQQGEALASGKMVDQLLDVLSVLVLVGGEVAQVGHRVNNQPIGLILFDGGVNLLPYGFLFHLAGRKDRILTIGFRFTVGQGHIHQLDAFELPAKTGGIATDGGNRFGKGKKEAAALALLALTQKLKGKDRLAGPRAPDQKIT